MNYANNTEHAFKICKVYAEATHICLMLDMWTESDDCLEGVYQTLRDQFDAKRFAGAQSVLALNYCDHGETIAQSEGVILEDDRMRQFANWLAEQYASYTWPIDKFMYGMQCVVHWLDTHQADGDLCDLVNTVFEDAELNDAEVTFMAQRDAVQKLVKLAERGTTND